ncbi:response regulator [Parvularcula dongshanensis]|uniref:DNA-binding response OmpR family regulator n=1 Tax=Parvularcula dongshanensis TaxID=1173995 RepID=A0A840I002_9PROT|nr:response regulator [Parvularcula dongshanensis]MBB4657611.1 DNA-binding response OmpR family regulator [Parvularcula dongshanensis]
MMIAASRLLAPGHVASERTADHKDLLSGLRILVVEDEVLIAVELKAAFVEAGAEVCYARTLARGLAALDGQAFDAAILDVTLSATSTCLPIARALTQLGVPILVHSGDLDRKGELVSEIGAAVLAKPATAAQVLRRLLTVLDA